MGIVLDTVLGTVLDIVLDDRLRRQNSGMDLRPCLRHRLRHRLRRRTSRTLARRLRHSRAVLDVPGIFVAKAVTRAPRVVDSRAVLDSSTENSCGVARRARRLRRSRADVALLARSEAEGRSGLSQFKRGRSCRSSLLLEGFTCTKQKTSHHLRLTIQACRTRHWIA